MSRQSFNSVRSYFFRAHCARVEREQREYGGRGLDVYDLDDFRAAWFAATSAAARHIQASLKCNCYGCVTMRKPCIKELVQ